MQVPPGPGTVPTFFFIKSLSHKAKPPDERFKCNAETSAFRDKLNSKLFGLSS